MAVAEVCRNLACVGAEPVGLTDCLNFGSPERPHVMQQFARAIDGMAEACRALGVPIVSGNVSLYNETDGRAILPTPTIAGVGQLASPTHATRSRFGEEGLEILLVRPRASLSGPLGGSEYVAAHTGEVKGPLPQLDLRQEVALQRLLLDLARSQPKLARSAHDVTEGGLAVALAECCAAEAVTERSVGADVVLPPSTESLEAQLFGEAPTRVVLGVSPEHVVEVLGRAAGAGLEVIRLGTTGGKRLLVRRGGETLVDVAVEKICERRRDCLESIVGG
jgi:phosphoribosylformylglycinamidine synthase